MVVEEELGWSRSVAIEVRHRSDGTPIPKYQLSKKDRHSNEENKQTREGECALAPESACIILIWQEGI